MLVLGDLSIVQQAADTETFNDEFRKTSGLKTK